MNTLKFKLLAISLLVLGISLGQESLFNAQNIISPEINQDHTVVFRVFAPNAASVKLTGDFLPTEKVTTPYGEMDAPIQVDLTKDENGVWSYTSTKLSPELYSYSFIVDGLTITDVNNPFYIRDVASSKNIFIIDDGYADLYTVNDVDHGTVSKRWYDSPGLKMDRRLTIYTPPGYENSTSSYPVL